MNRLARLISLLALFCIPANLLAQQPTPPSTGQRPITIDDAFRIRDVKEPQLSPDAEWLAYVVTAASLKDDDNKSRIWMLPLSLAGAALSDPIGLTAADASSTHPRWSPDGKSIAFLSARHDGKVQVWLLNRLGGEAEKLTDTAQDVEDFLWSPDSRRIALVLRDPSPEELEAVRDKAKEDADDKESYRDDEDSQVKKKKADKPWVIDRLQFKEDIHGYLDRRRTHLYLFDLTSKSLTQITGGDFDDIAPAWSPDGKHLAFASNRTLPDPDANYNTDIWVVDADNTDKGAHLTKISSSLGTDESPAWSPDGHLIAFITQLDPKLFQYATKHLAIAPASGGAVKVLSQSFDRMVMAPPQFAPDGQSVYFIADDDGTQNLCRIGIHGGEVVRPIGGRLMVYDFHIAKSGEIAAQISKIQRPNEIYFLPATAAAQSAPAASSSGSSADLLRLTHVNDALFAQLRLASVEYVHYKSKDGTPLSGFLYKPLDYVPGTRVPTLLRPHGGPVWAWYSEFNFDEQLFAANGYAVLLPNPRGSSGYGEKFAAAIFADWGNKDFQDDMALVDYAIQQGIADPDKLGVGGWSYGGISTDFIIGQTQRFKAAISGAGEALNISNYGHDQYQRDYETELGRPWENQALWDKLSPFYKVKNITTPTLFMGGDADANVPILGGEQMYQALKSLGRTTELVVYPDEFHEFTTPSHIQDRLRRYLAWYNHYVKGDLAPATPPLEPPKAAKSK